MHIIFANFDTCLIFLWHLLTGISSFTQFFHRILAHFVCRTTVQPRTKLLRHFNSIFNFACSHHVQKEQICPPPQGVRLECLEVKNWSQMKWHVFVAVLGEKLLQNNQSLQSDCLWGFTVRLL